MKTAFLLPLLFMPFNISSAASETQPQLTNEQMLQKRHEAQQQRKEKIKAALLKNGHLACFTRQELYTLTGAKLLYDRANIDDPCLAYSKYMLYKGNIYLIKSNVMLISKRQQQLDSILKESQDAVSQLNTRISDRNTQIEKNIKYVKIMIGISESSSDNHFYNSAGEYIGTVQKNSRLNNNQIKTIKALHKQNKRLVSDNKKDIALQSRLNHDINIFNQIKERLDSFVSTVKSIRENLEKANSPKAASTENQSTTAEDKLKKLKALRDKKLISQELYDKKASEIMKSYL